MTSFDLVDEPWVQVVRAGRTVEVSLRQALVESHTLAGLDVGEPLETVAVLRQVLLPVLFDACGFPASEQEWGQRWSVGRVDAPAVESYLHEHRDHFDLFSNTRPFAQVAGLRTAKDETKPVSLLMPAMATGNNVPLYSARTEASPPDLTPARAARALLAAHCWDTAAIKSGAMGDPQMKAGKTTGNSTGPLGALGVTVPVGATLFETLMLNAPVEPRRDPSDVPQWRRNHDPSWTTRHARGPLDLMTWQARRIRLVTSRDAAGDLVLRAVVLAAGDRLQQVPVELEPHTAWRQVDKPKAGEPSNRPLRHQPGRAAWRGLEAMLATRASGTTAVSTTRLFEQLARVREVGAVPDDLRLQVLTVGVVYGNQSAVVEDVITDTIPLPVVALAAASEVRALITALVADAEALRRAADKLEDDLRLAGGGAKVSWDKGQHLGQLLIHRLTPVVRRLLAGLQREPQRVEEAEDAWRAGARRIALEVAEPALAAAPPGTFLGRTDGKTARRASTAERWYRASVQKALGPEPAIQPPSR